MSLGKNTVALIVIVNDTPILKTFLPEINIKSCQITKGTIPSDGGV